MPKINVLPTTVSELIAAGEVIERPASIVKELVENSIDAGAATVTVELQNGGVRYLRITDNGCGISPEDAPVAFLRHATSKVRTAADLDSIGTLGFRGEALASIAAVAHVEMLTRTADSDLGTAVRISASEVESVSEAGCPVGTTIVVRDVFYNVPARLKFLKKDVSEANAIQSILEKIALSHPEISFKLIRDGRIAFHTPGDGRLESVIYTVFGREFSQNLLPVDYELGGIRVTGFIGKPMYSRPNRSMQHFFVNGRYTRTKTGIAAIEEGFRSSIMVGKFPACVLMLQMPCNLVDVNVHPAKIEVRFVSEKAVFDAIYFGVKSAIAAGNEIAPAAEPPKQKGNLLGNFLQEEAEQQTFSAPVKPVSSPEKPVKVLAAKEVPVSSDPPVISILPPIKREEPVKKQEEAVKIPPIEIPPAQPEMQSAPIQSETLPPEPPELPPEKPVRTYRIRIFGELFATYILAQIDDTFAMIDKHAAHERILYNRLKESQDGLDKQYLLTSIAVTLSRAEHEAVLDRLETLDRLGFAVEDFGGNVVMLRAVPAVVSNTDPKEMFLEIAAGMVSMRKQELPDVVEDILHRIACRSAVKANDQNHEQELQHLVETICSDENVRFCPHGRPVILQYSKAEIEKMFGRIQ
ncbi:MAG: DNA mismatch repair endonuclease MutL [Candidatus Merdivicinus sp.]|jgi:DNA mismatch repair protein MutL